MNKIEEIIERVPIKEVLARYWGQPDRTGRYRCVFHNGKDNNMVALDRRCYCFVCNASGNVINVVRTIFNSTTKQAMKMLDSDFNLGLEKPLTQAEKEAYAKRQAERQKEIERKERMEAYAVECLNAIRDKLKIADDYIEKKSFHGEIGSAEMQEYARSTDYTMFLKAIERKRWLEWLWCVIVRDSHYLVDEDFCATYGTDKVEILRKVYKGEIKI